VLIDLKSGNLNRLEPLGPVLACNGIALPLLFYVVSTECVFGGYRYSKVCVQVENQISFYTQPDVSRILVFFLEVFLRDST